ncbi:translation initiation factor eIF 4e-like domain-containing protein [Amylocarpus encephaloides]|uniref:Translation initiation factor eIF 4e-like domain-containing protein n=1 Tax=Amylocarpus encephaloides TaxID=45428 RepID=A0A9P7YJN2_9HELO|nr:translation initiation factor eIF 4e-like domain-containing protein [Amylocarpus encephaloides]
MDNLWSRRSNSKLSLATGTPSTNGAPTSTDHSAPKYAAVTRRHGDGSAYSSKNPFTSMSPSTTSLASPTGASSAFGLGSGAFASFGSSTSKTPKTPGGVLDFGSVVGSSGKTPTTEKQAKDLSSRSSKTSVADSKSSTAPSHTLRHSWVFWFRPPISKSTGFVEYEKTLHPIAGFDTAEDFFAVYRHLKRPSILPLVSDFHIFKKGIRPVWEDGENRKGGKWIVRLKKGVADRYWEELVFAIVGDQFAEASEEVCGAVLSVRNGEDILSIWTRNDGGRVLKIRETMKRSLGFPPETKVEWKSHDSSIAQRTAIDDARKDKSNQHNHHSSPASSRHKDHDHSSHISDKKQNS